MQLGCRKKHFAFGRILVREFRIQDRGNKVLVVKVQAITLAAVRSQTSDLRGAVKRVNLATPSPLNFSFERRVHVLADVDQLFHSAGGPPQIRDLIPKLRQNGRCGDQDAGTQSAQGGNQGGEVLVDVEKK